MTPPIDPGTIERLLAEAEDAYSGARWGQALESFKAVITFDPANPQAWLRIGNLHQRRGNLLAAASAYRKAGAGPKSGVRGASSGQPIGGSSASLRGGDASGQSVRLKALVNLASVNLELARTALEEARALAADGTDSTASLRDARAALGAEVSEQAAALERFSGARAGAAEAEQRPARAQERAAARGPRGESVRPVRLQGGIVPRRAEPDSGSDQAVPPRPAGRTPSIEYLRGAPRS